MWGHGINVIYIGVFKKVDGGKYDDCATSVAEIYFHKSRDMKCKWPINVENDWYDSRAFLKLDALKVMKKAVVLIASLLSRST